MRHKYEEHEGTQLVSERSDGTVLNVVFVHGLGGGAYSTWDTGARSALGYWPASLARELPHCCVWTHQYTARVFEWNPFARGRSIDLLDRAVCLLNSIVGQNLAEKPLVFVAHSLGGLVVKQALQFAQSMGEQKYRPVWDQTRAVVFLATPHVGSVLANAAIRTAEAGRSVSALSRVILRPSPALKNLEKHNPTLRYLSQWYLTHAPRRSIETRAFAEGRPCRGAMVVDVDSANPRVPGCLPVTQAEDDHVSIAKPSHKEHAVYQDVINLLKRLEGSAAATMASRAPVDPVPTMNSEEDQADYQRLLGRLCGSWWERITVQDKNAISFLVISREPLYGSVRLNGSSYDFEGKLFATWESKLARVEQVGTTLRLEYLWTGERRTGAGKLHGFGWMDFNEPSTPGRMVSSGAGKFWDVDESHPENTVQKSIELRRVADEGAARIIHEGTDLERKTLLDNLSHSGNH